MVGKGSPTFAVWGYVIANMEPDKTVGAQVDLNPTLLSAILGESELVIKSVIEMLCKPDERSRTKEHQGCRLIRLGEFTYQVVNGARYAAIRSNDERREYHRNYKRKVRALLKSQPLVGERQYLAMEARGEDVSQEPGGKVPLPCAAGPDQEPDDFPPD